MTSSPLAVALGQYEGIFTDTLPKPLSQTFQNLKDNVSLKSSIGWSSENDYPTFLAKIHGVENAENHAYCSVQRQM